MLLTQDQLHKIDVILDKLGLDFLDFKLEVKDHIACQVESIMESKTITFEEATLEVLRDWEEKLIPTQGWLMSNGRTFPKMVTKKVTKRFLLYNLALFSMIGLSVFIFMSLDKNFIERVFENETFLIFYGLIEALYIVLWGYLHRQNIKTSYSYQFKQIAVLILMEGFMVFGLNVSITNCMAFFTIIGISPFLFFTFYKHQQFIKKYHLV
ncbi:hypothetical protein ACFS5J_09580 [Flavobacterium chuncheonense]|uniref:DUF1129 family protein n=1 Tax=Flavobacterium chuncheonense TaxID=2026653 RepID=A0ABW5YMG6_9FLAO